MTNPNGGALAYLGNTNVGLGAVGGTAQISSFFTAIFEHGLGLGDALNYSRDNFYTSEASLQSETLGVRWTQLAIVLFGDPEMPVYSRTPDQLILSAPATMARAEQCLEILVSQAGQAVAGATVALHREGDFIYRAYTNDEGKASFRLAPTTAGDIRVTATHTNAVPALGTIQVP